MLEDFRCIDFAEDFAGDFPGGFFWALFPTKMRGKNPARKSTKKSGGSKIKIREKSVLSKAGPKILEAQQRYFSYREILVAIVSQNSFVLVFMGYRTTIAQYVAKRGIAQMCMCKTKCQGGGVSHHFGEVPTSLKTIARWGVSQR